MSHNAGAPKVAIILQARMRSTRLPGKVLMQIGEQTTLALMIHRLRKAKLVDELVVATSDQPDDDVIAAACDDLGARCLRGDEQDVLSRYAMAARQIDADVVVRITADCPLADPEIVDAAIDLYRRGDAEYVSNVIERTYPDGLDVEVFSSTLLYQADKHCHDQRMREHVTPYMRTGVYRDVASEGGNSIAHLKGAADFSSLRWTLDEPEDLDFFKAILGRLGPDVSWLELTAYLCRHPDLLAYNRQKKWRVGALEDLRRSKSQDEVTTAGRNKGRYDVSNELFARAIDVVPLASQTFSKSHLQYVLGAAPLFLKRGKGCRVEDVDGNDYIDYVSGLMSLVLGYCDPDVDAAIIRQMENGISFSLATELEYQLSEVLKRIIPCCDMARFGKNGSDATSAAIRLARAYTGNDKVLVAGYHGWHDWYIGTTTRDLGVPETVAKMTTKVPFGDAALLEDTIKAASNDFAAVILEPTTTVAPPEGYLQSVREICDRYGVVLIFDEIVSGFRVSLGGAQEYYDVVPDLACFGKAMGNGMPISAVVGKQPIMKLMEDIFFSATFGGETLSLAASVATIAKLEREDIPAKLSRHGELLSQALNRSIDKAGLQQVMTYAGNNWWPRLAITDPPVATNLFSSLLKQALNANGLLMGNSLNMTRAHLAPAVLPETLNRYDAALQDLNAALNTKDPVACLRGREIQPTFAVR